MRTTKKFIKPLLLVVAIIGFASVSAAQKAYDAVYYTGKTQNITVKLTLANGYIGASEIKTTDSKTKKTSQFLPESGSVPDDKKLKFSHHSPSNKSFTDYFILDAIEENYDRAPKIIYGTYYFNGRSYSITFTKMKS